jgi:hypothetical protein
MKSAAEAARPRLSLPKPRTFTGWALLAICVLTVLLQFTVMVEMQARLGKICLKTGGTPNLWEGCLYGEAPAARRLPTPTPPARRVRP